MKLRIKDTSVRLRLTQSEVDQFTESGIVQAVTPFGKGRALTYSLSASEEAGDVEAHFDGDTVSIVVPASKARQWATTDEVGFEAEQTTEDGALHILVEKDFQCLHKPQERKDPDAFQHPLEQIDG